MRARIVRILSKDYTLQMEDGTRILAVAMGKVRLQDKPVIGCNDGTYFSDCYILRNN